MYFGKNEPSLYFNISIRAASLKAGDTGTTKTAQKKYPK